MSEKKRPEKTRISRIRGIVSAVIFFGLGILLFFRTGFGTLSSFGWQAISFICPLGALETLLAAKTLIPRVIIALVVVIVLVVLFGRFFCAWICPAPHISEFFHARKNNEIDNIHTDVKSTENHVLQPVGGKRDGFQLDLRHVVLVVALVSAFVFGFPVFCLICPVGLTFGTLIAIYQLFVLHSPTWMLIAFPLALAIELIVCKKWCHTLCPMGALMSLLSQKAPFFKPKVDKQKCLREQGENCLTCVRVCPEELDPHSDSLGECTKCAICAESCPAQAIALKLASIGKKDA